MKKALLLLLLISSFGFAQNLNDYKYALVPASFNFLKEPNMYDLNVLSKKYMEKYGFETYLDSETYSVDFANTNFNKIYVDVIEKSNLFTTRLKIVLKDYQNKILFTSDFGTSNEKEYRVAYGMALRMAFDNFSVLKNHQYRSDSKAVTLPEASSNDTSKSEVGETTSEFLNNKLSVVKTENGFELYSTENKLILSAKSTSAKNVFIAIAGVENGVLQKGKDDLWYFEYYREGSKKLISENLFFKL